MMPVLVPSSVIAGTLEILQEGGRLGCECVVLWLASRTARAINVVEFHKPPQHAAEDFFRIPRESIAALLEKLGERQLMVAAQVHSHPFHAFHSQADDQWAIVRHVGALSLVLPDFALRTTAATFFQHAATFALSPANLWVAVPSGALEPHLREVP